MQIRDSMRIKHFIYSHKDFTGSSMRSMGPTHISYKFFFKSYLVRKLFCGYIDGLYGERYWWVVLTRGLTFRRLTRPLWLVYWPEGWHLEDDPDHFPLLSHIRMLWPARGAVRGTARGTDGLNCERYWWVVLWEALVCCTDLRVDI